MTDQIALSTCAIPDSIDISRAAPRPMEHRNERYEAQFDRKTLFYDVYRSGNHIVFQGPPLFNLKKSLLETEFFARALGSGAKGRLIERNRGQEIWIEASNPHVEFKGELGSFSVDVQPDESGSFKGKRVMLTLSKDNEVKWIVDWIAFHRRLHGVEAVLFYDNRSSIYAASELQQELRAAFPEMLIVVVDWPYKYGPQGGVSGGVGGRIAPWDSDFCQTGSFQHARFRFLRQARSVLNCDIDELVVPAKGRSVFEAAESSLLGIVDFAGTWVSNVATQPAQDGLRKHSDYIFLEQNDRSKCPNKWCVVPGRCRDAANTWSVHAVTGRSNFLTRTRQFNYRHFKPISNNWKYARWEEKNDVDIAVLPSDEALRAAMAAARI